MATADLEEYQRLKRRIEDINRIVSQAEGELRAIQRGLKEEFGVDSLSTAEKKLEELESNKLELEKQFSKELAEFKQKWGDRLS
jgi:predicted  nucleic acid-binding Zn-ribbon protein